MTNTRLDQIEESILPLSGGDIHAWFTNCKVIWDGDEEDLSFDDSSRWHLNLNRLLGTRSTNLRLKGISLGCT